MQEEEREELFNNMNKMERSRIINLADKHCAQMMELIYRYTSLIRCLVFGTYCMCALQ
jgi:hypothetical protein